MTTTTTPRYDHLTDQFVGAAGPRDFNPDSRVAVALRDRLNDMTWREVADRNGYRSAAVAEYNVGRYIAVLNGVRTNRRVTAGTAPSMSTRRYGVEVEFQGCTMAAAAAAINRAGIVCENTGRYHASRSWEQWRIEYDSSVTTRRGTGGEAVSPILNGTDGLEQITKVVNAIRSVGGRVSRATGIHVHIDASDMTGEQIARLMCAYDDRTEAFDQFVAPSRQSASYNRTSYVGRMSVAEKQRVKDALTMAATKEAAIAASGIHANRYRNVNVTCLGRTGTVEFRQHQGSLNGTKITAWVKTLLALAESVMATEDEHLPFDPADLIQSLTGYGLDDAAARHMTRRVAA